MPPQPLDRLRQKYPQESYHDAQVEQKVAVTQKSQAGNVLHDEIEDHQEDANKNRKTLHPLKEICQILHK